jgi:hypothetical protein
VFFVLLLDDLGVSVDVDVVRLTGFLLEKPVVSLKLINFFDCCFLPKFAFDFFPLFVEGSVVVVV